MCLCSTWKQGSLAPASCLVGPPLGQPWAWMGQTHRQGQCFRHTWTGTGWQTDRCGQPAGLGDRSEGPSSTPAGSPGTPEGKQLCGQTPLRNALPTGAPRTRLPRAVQGRRAVGWFLLVEHALLGRRVTSASSHEGTVRMRSTSSPTWAETLRPLGGVLCTDP